jgi:hypothetical protein
MSKGKKFFPSYSKQGEKIMVVVVRILMSKSKLPNADEMAGTLLPSSSTTTTNNNQQQEPL